MKLPRSILDELLDLGRGGYDRVPESLYDEDGARRTLVCGNDVWVEAAWEVGVSNVPDLIRGLVRYSRASGRGNGGSVSPVIVLHRIVVERLPEAEPELTQWVVTHRTNPYEPFGTVNDEGASTYADYVARRALRVGKAQANERFEAERQEHAQRFRREREQRESTERLGNAVRRGDLAAVRALLDKGADAKLALPDGGSLVVLAVTNGRDTIAEFLRQRGIE